MLYFRHGNNRHLLLSLLLFLLYLLVDLHMLYLSRDNSRHLHLMYYCCYYFVMFVGLLLYFDLLLYYFCLLADLHMLCLRHGSNRHLHLVCRCFHLVDCLYFLYCPLLHYFLLFVNHLVNLVLFFLQFRLFLYLLSLLLYLLLMYLLRHMFRLNPMATSYSLYLQYKSDQVRSVSIAFS